MEAKYHYVNRSGWLRAAVLGANDGIISISSLAIGVAAANASRETLILSTVAGLVAGALSMAAGEYVSVSSQSDVENSDLKRELKALNEMPEKEFEELITIYENRGLDRGTATLVAEKLTQHNALEAHARDELGINEITKARPFQAALASAASFVFGGALPLVVTLFGPMKNMVYTLYGSSIIFLVFLGALTAKTGGSNMTKAILRITFWGTAAMIITALIGNLFNACV